MTHPSIVIPECPYPLLGKDLLTEIWAQIHFLPEGPEVRGQQGEPLQVLIMTLEDEYQLFEETILKDIIFGPKNFGISEDDARNIAKETLNLVGLNESYLEKSPFDLSGGQKRRVAIAGILAMNPDILILDEPTAALDPVAESEIYNNYNKYSEGKTALFISHRLASTRFSDRIIMLEDGKVIEEGSHSELMALNGKYAEMFHIQSNYYEKGEIA